MNNKSSKKSVILAIIVIIAVLAVSYLYATTSKPQIDEQARQAAPGQFIRLTDGIIHYELAGPETARTVVLVHGLATPYFIWDNNYQALVQSGFRVLRYDHFGRGFSDRPDVTYDRELYDRELLELLQQLDIKLPVYLVGESMGGAVGTVFTDRHPEMVAKLALLAPAGFPIEESLAMKIAKIPVIGDYLMAMVGDRVVLEGVKDAFVDTGDLAEYIDKFKVQLQYSGFQHAILSTLRHLHMHSLEDTYQRVGMQQKPVLLIWGDKDQVLPFAYSEKVKNAIPHVMFHKITGAGHNLGYEFSVRVNPLLLDFLSQ